MFTGIVKEAGKIRSTEAKKALNIVSIDMLNPPVGGWRIKLGESVAVNGVCSTVAKKSSSWFMVEYMPETLRVTNAGGLRVGDVVNLERSLKYGDAIDGHFVTGHIDCIGVIGGVNLQGKSKVLSVVIPKIFLKYIAYKGSVTLDGVALTISKKLKAGFEVSLVPYTLKHTNLDKRRVGDRVNIECDIIAKYLDAKRANTK